MFVVTADAAPPVVLALTLLHGYMLRQSGLQTMGNVAASVTQGNVVYTLSIFCAWLLPTKLVKHYLDGCNSDVDRQHHFLCLASQSDA